MESPSFKHEWLYDVFLSFRGADTRLGFTGNLYSALCERGVKTFIDEDELQRQEQISPSLHQAIKHSKIAIIVFSKNYAFSSFCLDELVIILECSKENNGLVLPIFYGVHPSDLRYQRGSYGEAFALHGKRLQDNKDRLSIWRTALREAADLSGFDFKHGDEYEHVFIEKIAKEVSRNINNVSLHVGDYPVGLESRVLQVNSFLELGSNDVVHMVGIHGLGGIGKTTLAQAVYDLIGHQFEGLSFLANVREKSMQYGLVHLQELLLSHILGEVNINILNLNNGTSIIKHRLRRKKVLVVLDDVDSILQLKALVGATDWFGSGSRVIITTRDRHLLEIHGVERTYEVDRLSEEEAFVLFSHHAFKTQKTDGRLLDVANRILTYTHGLPLAVRVVGSFMHRRSINEWESALEMLKDSPPEKIEKTLQISFDSLEQVEQQIFLDIACFFNGHKLAVIEDILCAHYSLSIKSGIQVLFEKCLITIHDDIVRLHDVLQEMGRNIVQQESPSDPSKCSRLWFFEDIVRVLQENKGTSEIQTLVLDFPKDEVNSNGPKVEEIYWDGEAFKKMKNLKTLIIRNGRFYGGPRHLPDSLRVLKWWGYPSPSLPYDFHPKKLAILELHNSFLKTSKPIQRFVSLTVLDFSNSDWITHMPDVSGLLNLEKLSFKHCENLEEIHQSVGFLVKLRILDVVCCKKLKTFPPIRLTSLENLNLSYCSVLENFPEILGKMENMTELHIMGSPIKELPFSIKNLTRLRKIELQYGGMVRLPSSVVMLPELCLMNVSRCEGLHFSKQDNGEEVVSVSSNMECLILSYCKISDESLPIGLTWFANVKDLDLSGNNFSILHSCIKKCHFLRNLKLDDCLLLQEISGIPWELETFSVKRCTSLKDLDLTVSPDEECLSLRELILDDCVYLREIRGFLPNLDHFSAENCTSLTSWSTNKLLNQESVEAGNKMFCFPGTKVPEWFDHFTRGESTSFWFRRKFPAISLCLVIGQVHENPITVKFSPRVFIKANKQSLASQKVYEFKIATDHICVFDLQLLKFEDNVEPFTENEWNHVEISYADHISSDEAPIKVVAKLNGIHVSKQTSSMEDIQFTNPFYKTRTSDFLLTWESKTSLKEKHKLGDMGVSETQFIQKQQYIVLLTPHVEQDIDRFSLVPAQAMNNVNWNPNSIEGPSQRIKTTAKRPRKAQIVRPSLSILTLTEPPPTEAEKVQACGQTPSVKRRWEDVGGEMSERLPEDEVLSTPTQNGPPVNEEGRRGDGVEHEAVSCKHESEESSSNAEGSDSDDPFDRVNSKLSVSRKQTTSSGASSGDASLTSIQEAIDAFELLMIKDLAEVFSDPATLSPLDHLLDQLSPSSHSKVTIEVKRALFKFKTKVFALFKEFQATVECVNKLKNFQKQRTRIQQESDAGKAQWKDVKSTRKKASLVIKAENSRKKELEAEIETLRKQLGMKERDLEQLVLNVKNQEATLSACSKTCASLDEQAQSLIKECDGLVAANIGVEDEGEAAELKQDRLNSTWSTDLTGQFIKIKKKILDLYA